MDLVLIVMGALLIGIALHPFITFPLSLWVRRKVAPRGLVPAAAAEPTIALCVCAYNEEAVIGAKAENMLSLQQRHPGLDLRVYVDCASDRTAEILDRHAQHITTHVATERHGKTHGMNLLVRGTRADIIVFSDANVMLAHDAIEKLIVPFRDPAVGCVVGHLRYVVMKATATAVTGALYWRIEERIKQLESDTGSVMGADGSIFAIRRRLHTPPPDDIIDDMFVSFSILCDGHRIVRAGDAIAEEEIVPRGGDEFRRKIRIACQAFNVHRLLWPRLKQLPGWELYCYISHKLIRWNAIFLLVAGGAAFLLGLLLARLWWIALPLIAAAGLFVLLGRTLPASPAAKLMDMLMAFVATGLGVIRSLRGDRFQTWSPAASIRKDPAGA